VTSLGDLARAELNRLAFERTMAQKAWRDARDAVADVQAQRDKIDADIAELTAYVAANPVTP
jgi:hypothetical protein